MRAKDTWTARPTVTVWVYDSPRGAYAGRVRLERLHRQGAVCVEDAVTVSWVPGAHRPRIDRVRLGTAALEGSGSPLAAVLGLVVMETSGAEAAHQVGGRLRGIGLDEEFLTEVRRALVPGSSAMLVLSTRADFDAVRTVIERGTARGDVRLLHAILTDDGVEVLAGLVADERTNAGGAAARGVTSS